MRLLLLIAFAFCMRVVVAADAVPIATDPVYAKRAMHLASQLRCLVCQNQTIADSNADLAQDLRKQIAEQIDAGRSDQQIIDYMVERYGDFVLYRPPFKARTALLWLGPALFTAIGLTVLLLSLRERRKHTQNSPLSEAEHREAEQLLGSAPSSKQ